MLSTWECPYCSQEFTENEIEKHVSICYMWELKRRKENNGRKD